MPKPAYMICSQSGSVDQFLNSVSCFNLIESLETIDPSVPADKDLIQVSHFAMRIVAAWRREQNEENDVFFESELLVIFADHENAQHTLAMVKFDNFRFETPNYRFVVPHFNLPGVNGPGEITVENRIRQVGTEEWKKQQFQFLIVRRTGAQVSQIATTQ